MESNLSLFKTSMPDTRSADYHLGCLDGSVFMDFNSDENDLVHLVAISCDGYGYCGLPKENNPLNIRDSKVFLHEIKKPRLNQAVLESLVKKLIEMNKEDLWQDALGVYNLI
jgi:hypothetical protein